MGSIPSRILALSDVLKEISTSMKLQDDLVARIKVLPGFPVPNPTKSFWMSPPSKISSCPQPTLDPKEDEIPKVADVVIIGSGVTGTSIARTLLQEAAKTGGGDGAMKVAMLEARQTCSGATGRNGGHINPSLYHDYTHLKRNYGLLQAKKIVMFRLAHNVEMRRAALEECLVEQSQIREVESVNVFFSQEVFEEMKRNLEVWREDMPIEAGEVGVCVYEREEAIKRFRVAEDCVGVITNIAGAVHPYRLVTGILESLLTKYTKSFELYTETPCTSIHPPSPSSPLYTIETPDGSFQTRHVVHATNGWVSHLIPGLRGKVVPLRGTMTAQRPGAGLFLATSESNEGMRSWLFVDGDLSFDYLTQLPDGEKEMMLGGGGSVTMRLGLTDGERSLLRFRKEGSGGSGSTTVETGMGEMYPELGTARDDLVTRATATHLAGSLPLRFGLENWGREKIPPSSGSGPSGPESGSEGTTDNLKRGERGEEEWFEGRIKAIWTGIMAISADSNPWVGRLDEGMTGRRSSWNGAETHASTQKNPNRNDKPFWLWPRPPESTLQINSTHESESNQIPSLKPPNSPPAPAQAPSTGEWIAAGYSGEGMTLAWMCGRALAYMILGEERGKGKGGEGQDGVYEPGGVDGWLPEAFRVSEKRWKEAVPESLVRLGM